MLQVNHTPVVEFQDAAALMRNLRFRVAIVTGGANGIGRGIAEALARSGVAVAIADIKPADSVVCEIEAQGGIATAFRVDVTDSRGFERFVGSVLERFERIDILVNNAGISQSKNILEISEEDWDQVLAVNLKSAFLCSKAVLPEMIRQRHGRIINISSIVARRGALFGHVHYAASKAGLLGLTRTLALWAAEHGITVNAVAPGSIETEMISKIHTDEEIQEVVNRTPLRKMGTSADVGNLVSFLAGEAAGNMTGCVIDTNGGQWMGS